jgi:hypothetical protein
MDIFNQSQKGGGSSAYPHQLQGTADRFLTPFTSKEFWNLDIPAMATESLDYGYRTAPGVNQFNMGQLQKLLGQALPGYQQMVNTSASNTQALLQGQIPQDVQDQISRTTAQQAMAGGFAGTGAAKSLTARDLGLTSLQLQQTGQSQMTSLIGTARNYLMPQPVNPSSLLPLSDLIGGAEWSKSATFQANQAAYTAFANALAAQYGQPQQSIMGGIGGDISSLVNALGKKNPDTGQSGLGGIMSLFNMGGSSGGGGIMNMMGTGTVDSGAAGGGSISAGLWG